MPSSVAMAFVNQIPDPFAGRQLDKPLLGKLDHAANGLAAAILVKAADVGQTGQSGGKHFVDRFKLAAGQLLSDDPLLLRFEFDGHTSNLAPSVAPRKLWFPWRSLRGHRSRCDLVLLRSLLRAPASAAEVSSPHEQRGQSM